MSYYENIGCFDFYKVQKEKSIWSILSETMRGSKNVRRKISSAER